MRDAGARELPHRQPRALQQRARLAGEHLDVAARRRARAITASAEPAPPVASAPVLQCVRIRRAPASRSAPCAAIAADAASSSASIASASARAAARHRRSGRAARRRDAVDGPGEVDRGRARVAQRRMPPARRVAGGRGDLDRQPVCRGDPDQRRAAHREPPDRVGGVAPRRTSVDPLLAARQQRLVEQPAGCARPSAGRWPPRRADRPLPRCYAPPTIVRRMLRRAVRAPRRAAALAAPPRARRRATRSMPLGEVRAGMQCTVRVGHPRHRHRDVRRRACVDVIAGATRRRRRADPDPRLRPGRRRDRRRPRLLRLADLLPRRRRRRSAIIGAISEGDRRVRQRRSCSRRRSRRSSASRSTRRPRPPRPRAAALRRARPLRHAAQHRRRLARRSRRVSAPARRAAGRAVLAGPAAPRAGRSRRRALVPGSAVSVGYASGDLSAGAVGTVAYVDGDAVWALRPSARRRRAPRRCFLQDAYVYDVVNNPLGRRRCRDLQARRARARPDRHADSATASSPSTGGSARCRRASRCGSRRATTTPVASWLELSRLADETRRRPARPARRRWPRRRPAVVQATYGILRGSPVRQSGDDVHAHHDRPAQEAAGLLQHATSAAAATPASMASRPAGLGRRRRRPTCSTPTTRPR